MVFSRLLSSVRPVSCLALGLAFLNAGCGSDPTPAPPAQPEPATFSVLSYNLGTYALADRDGDGQINDPKPDREKEAVAAEIARQPADILALQGLGRPAELEDLRRRLKARGITYEFSDMLRKPASGQNIAVLSRFPLVGVHHHREEVYSIKGEPLSPVPGIFDIDVGVRPGYRIKLLLAHFKDKTYHPLGQTEMRRNEARILNQIVRAILERDPGINVLVAGSFHDDVDSGVLRTLTGEDPPILTPLPLEDAFGASWTFESPEPDLYLRSDYILVNDALRPEVQREHCSIGLSRETLTASPHRPLFATFEAVDRPHTTAGGNASSGERPVP